VLELLSPSNKFKLAPIRIIREEGKNENIILKSRPRRRSTMKNK